MREGDEAGDLSRGSSSGQGGIRAFLLQRLERLSGVHKHMQVYDIWRRDIAPYHPRKMNELLRMLDVQLQIDAPVWPPDIATAAPVVMVANHPFGIGDGIALAAMAEQLDRPYKVLINTEFLRIKEFHQHCLPIDFSNTREAIATNLATRKAALQSLAAGETLLVFPAGTVATAPMVFGRAQEVPWKMFTAALVQKAQANVLPVFFEGQNSALFHAASHISASARMSLLIAEFRRFPGSRPVLRCAGLIPFETLPVAGGRQELTDALFLAVHRLAPWAQGKTDAQLLPPYKLRQRPYKWDLPLGR